MAYPGYQHYRYTDQLIDTLQSVFDGKKDRVMIFMPPRHGKSLTVTQLFSAYYLHQRPSDKVCITSYNKTLAAEHSSEAMDHYRRAGGELDPSAQAKANWQTKKGGQLFAQGVGGSILGRGFGLGIIDDPIKNAEEAFSPTYRRKNKDWYRSTFYNRLDPGASIIVIQQRWHRDDLAGWLLSEEAEREDDTAERWHIVCQEAIREGTTIRVPGTCSLEPDFRDEGEALCPERYSLRDLRRIKANAGDFFWNAQYQQRPVAEDGQVYNPEWFAAFKEVPEDVTLEDEGVHWDLAQTSNEENSASAYVRAARGSDGRVYVLDCGFRWVEYPELIRWMRSMVGPHFIENKSAGLSAIQSLRSEGVMAAPVDVKGDKLSRARLVTPACERGDVVVHASCYDTLLFDPKQGLTDFPSGKKDDLPDAFSQALSHLTIDDDKAKKKRTIGGFSAPAAGFL